MTILCEPNRATAAAVATHLTDGQGVRIVDNLTDAAAWVGYDADERLVVIGAAVPFIDVVAFADYMHTIYPDALLVLVRSEADEDVVLEAMAAGITEVVPAADEPALMSACERARYTLRHRGTDDADEVSDDIVDDVDPIVDTVAGAVQPETEAIAAQLPKAMPVQPVEPEQPYHVDEILPAVEVAPLGEVVTVFSAKGGTGKTVVSTNLALALHNDGARRVCLVDLDLEFGDVAISMKLSPTRSIIDALEIDLRAPDAVSSLLTPYAPRFDCVLAPVHPGEAERVSPAVIATILKELRLKYDYVVIDTPSQFSEHVLEAFDASDHQVLVTTPEIPALKNLRLTLDMLDMLDYDRDRRSILLNRADPKAGLARHDVENAIRAVITADLPATQNVPASINKGLPLVLSDKDSAFARAVRSFAESTVTHVPVVSAGRRRRFGLKLRKRLS
ncbi:MAG TPA: P-loop NTPase [Jatrophihabitantaceae bacterium]